MSPRRPREQALLLAFDLGGFFGIIRERSPFYRSLRPRHFALISSPARRGGREQRMKKAAAPFDLAGSAAVQREEQERERERERRRMGERRRETVTRSSNP